MIWVAHHEDFSEFAIFAEEIECLRYALDHTMSVARVELGRGVAEQLREQYAARRAQWPA